MAYNFDCRYFNGYKPCKFKRPCDGCTDYDPVKSRIAILHTEALGAVLRSTCLLKPLRRRYPQAHITWITFPNAAQLLENNPEIDRLLTVDAKMAAALEYLEFDLLFSVDKSIAAGALAEKIKARKKFGFGLTPGGAIRPLNEEAHYQFDVGLDDHLKFHVNQKPETQQTTETMGLKWERDPYILELTAEEKILVGERRRQILGGAKGVIGFNTGCSVLYPYKKFTVERSIDVIRMWRTAFPQMAVALFGGIEDAERHQKMKTAFARDPLVVDTPTSEGLRSGVLWVDTADMVFSGCSLGMHIAIGLKKPVVAWFGVSCPQEVDLYERGIKLLADVGCSPCWLKSCDKTPKCYNEVSVAQIQEATAKILHAMPVEKVGRSW